MRVDQHPGIKVRPPPAITVTGHGRRADKLARAGEMLEVVVDVTLDKYGYCDGTNAADTFRQIVRLDADGGRTIVRPYEPPRRHATVPADLPFGCAGVPY